MLNLQAVKFARLIDPAAIKDNGSWTGVEIDTLGFDYLTIVCYYAASDIAMAALYLTESDATGSGHVEITATDFSDTTQLDLDGAALALPSATDDPSFLVVHLDLRKRKRFINIVATGGDGSAGAFLTALGILSRAEHAPASSAEQGAHQVVVV